MATARKQLAQLLSFRFREKKLQVHFVARRCNVTPTDVEQWLNGTAVPNSGEWEELKQLIAGDMLRYTGLWRSAKTEQDTERRAEKSVEIEPSPKMVTNLGDKILEEAAKKKVAAEPPANTKSAKRSYPSRPGGSMSSEAKAERRQYAKAILLQRPSITAGGPDGLLALLRQRFGVGLDPRIVSDIRAEMKLERNGARPEIAAVPVTVVAQSHNSADLEAGIELIMNAVPGLQQLTISVSDTGEVSVDFQIRKVEIQTIGGSLKLRSK